MNINIRGELFDLTTPKVMGILNLTPSIDSTFYRVKFWKIMVP